MRVELNGTKIFVGTPQGFELSKADLLEEHGCSESDLTITLSPDELRIAVRSRIAAEAGDTESLLGTTSDVAALGLLHDMATIVAETQSGGDFAKFVQIKHGLLSQIAGDAEIGNLAADFLGKVRSGEVVVPIMAKGLPKALAEMADRSNAVTKALSGS